jgi:hypothetical protein
LGEVPPFTTVAVKVVLAPEQIVVVAVAIVTDGVTGVEILIVILLLLAVALV